MDTQLPWIIFDFDGTLADTFVLATEAINSLANHYGYDLLDPKTANTFRQLSATQVLKKLNIKWYQRASFLLSLRKYIRAKTHRVKLFQNIPKILKKLKSNGYSLGIVSSNSAQTIQNVLMANHCDFFDFIHEESSFFGKAKIFKKIIKKYSIPKSTCYYIGDEVRDIHAAQAIPIKILAATWGFNSESILKHAHPNALLYKPEDIGLILSK